jgi:hypothetical protein
MSSE